MCIACVYCTYLPYRMSYHPQHTAPGHRTPACFSLHVCYCPMCTAYLYCLTQRTAIVPWSYCHRTAQFTRVLDILEDWLAARGWGALRIDGTIPGAERQRRIDMFNSKV